MSIKFKRLLVIYTAAALVALGAVSYVAEAHLNDYRRAADYSAARAFEEAVTAVDALSLSLKKLDYVTDPALGKSLCAAARAQALAGETALSVLPFATQELEQLSGFLNRAGDYAGSLCALPEESLPDSDREHLAELSAAAADFAEQLRGMQSQLHDGSIAMDSREVLLQNVGTDARDKLSARLLGYEGDFDAPAEFDYEGQFSPAAAAGRGSLTEAESRAVAAKAAGVEERELREVFTVEGPEGRRCYSAAGMLIGVSSRGLEYTARSRLIGESLISEEKARDKAEQFLETNGYTDLQLCESGGSETLAVFSFAPVQDEALRLDDAVRISVAMDDGSIYSMDATRYDPEPVEVSWETEEDAAAQTLPEELTLDESRRVIIHSPGGHPMACYLLRCTGPEGESVTVYVDAATGRQCKIELG
ncbi:MAG: germination protein YpeB [Oscillospiraceae bacterium]|nr:germination protein YpeB [Oscillospiraceae bacterium]